MEFLSNTANLYFASADLFFSPGMIFLALLGTFLGIIFGAIPGLTSTMGIAIFIPLTFGLDPNRAIVFLMGIYFGSVYGGSISAILVNVPGTPAAVATVLDGYPMALKGEAGRAIGIATLSSCLGGVVGLFFLILIAPILAEFALKFASQEFVALVLLGLSIISYISAVSVVKGLIGGVIGLLLGTVGEDPMTAYPRFTMGTPYLISGLELIPVMIGLFGIAEILYQVEIIKRSTHVVQKLEKIIPSLGELKNLGSIIVRSSFIGTFIGAIPAAGPTIASIVSYGIQKRISHKSEEMGTGIPEGIAAPEGANNASVGGAMIPMLTLGIPGDSMTAVLIGALIIHGLQPGPVLFKTHPVFVSAIFIGMTVSIILTGLMGLCGARFFARMLMIPKHILLPVILIFCMVGSFAIRNSCFDVGVAMLFGFLGFILRKVEIHPAPIILGLILGRLLEDNFRRAMILSRGDITTFFTRPMSLIILLIAIFIIFSPLYRRLKISV